MAKDNSGIEKVFQTAKKVKEDKDIDSKNHEPDIAWNNKPINNSSSNKSSEVNFADISKLKDINEIKKEINKYNFHKSNIEELEKKPFNHEYYKDDIKIIKELSKKLDLPQAQLIRYIIGTSLKLIKDKI